MTSRTFFPDEAGQLPELFAQVYELLCEDEDTYMVSFREMLQGVCRELNEMDWRPICPVTDDFVVFPKDDSNHFSDVWPDIVRSVPPARLDLLRSRGLGPPEEWAN